MNTDFGYEANLAEKGLNRKTAMMGRNSRFARFAMRCRGFAKGLDTLRVYNAEDFAEPVAGPRVEVLNRDFKFPDDGYIHLVPVGEFPGVSTSGKEIVQVLDREVLQGLVSTLNSELLINYEHFAHDPEKESRAAGWFNKAELREDGIWVKPRWSNRGKSEVEGGEYRFISPEFAGGDPEPALITNGTPRWRPTRLIGAGLTNKPMLKTLKPLSNRETQPKENTMNEDEKKLLALLGLEEGATEAEKTAAYNRAKVAIAAAASGSQETEDLKAKVKSLEETLLNRDLKTYASVISDDDKESISEMLVSNREGTVKMLDKLVAKAAENPGGEQVYNRDTAKSPDEKKILDEEERKQKAADALATRVRNRASEIEKANPGLSFTAAYNRAYAELSEKEEAAAK